jgi:hypothetical protein
MPVAKQKRGVRITKTPNTKKGKRQKQDGRPKGTYKKFPFGQTKLGFMLKYEMPIIYNIIMQPYAFCTFPEPDPNLIEKVCKASRDPSYKKSKFRRYMNEYIAHGIYCKRGKYLTNKRRSYYESIRKNKLKQYIQKNKERIERMKKKILNL